MAVERLRQSERSQVTDILKEEGVGSLVTLRTILKRAPWLHPQRVSASLYSLYKVGALSKSDPTTTPGRTNVYCVLASIKDQASDRPSMIGYKQSGERVAHHPEEDTVDPSDKDKAVEQLMDAALAVEENYLADALEKTRAAYYTIKEAIRK